MKRLDLERAKRQVRTACAPAYRGRVERVSGLLVEAHGVPAAVGETCRIRRSSGDSVDAEVIGFDGARTLLMPHSELVGMLRNLFNERYADRASDEQLPDAIQQNGRTARVGLRWNLWTWRP